MDCFYPKFNILFVCLNVGLACNEATTNVELNLSNNNLSVHGANVLENCIGTVKCLSRLDLSENNLEAEMAGVMQGLAKNKSLLSLNASKNMTNVKAKYLSSVMESIVGLITSDESSVTKLNLSGKSMFVPLGAERMIFKLDKRNICELVSQCLSHLELRKILELGYGEHCLAHH